jgi:signal transduction histidine kinase
MNDTATASPARKRTSWPRVQLIYFLLAAFDLLAITGGLLLSREVIRIYEANVTRSAAFDRQTASAWVIAQSAADAQSAVVEGVALRDPDFTTTAFRTRVYEFRHDLGVLKSQIPAVFPERLVKRASAIVARIDQAMTAMEASANDAVKRISAQDGAGALDAIVKLQARYEQLREAIDDLNQLVARVKISETDQSRAMIADLRNYEYVIGGMIALIVCCVALYGHTIGRLIRRKYRELEEANERLHATQAEATAFAAKLQAVNDEVSALNHDLAANMKRLEEAQDEIIKRGRLSQLGQLTATVAHELRNPLGAVRTSAFLLARKLQGKGLGVEPQLERINNGIVRCDTIITELLDFSRSSAPLLQVRAVDDWVASVVQEQGEKLPPAVRVECELGLGNLEASFDPSRMERVLINLIVNASEAMVGKGDSGAQATPEPRIVVRTGQTERGIEISVSDNGPGISEENLARIREPLFSTKNFGTGLGLPAVERILDQHGGGLDIWSRPGAGARFTAWFPQAPAEKVAA